MRKTLCFLFLFGLPTLNGADKPKPVWQTGLLVDSQSYVQYGRDGIDRAFGIGAHNSEFFYLTVRSGNDIYLFGKAMTAFSATPQHTVNTPIKFMLRDHGVLVIDETGKRHKMQLVKRTLIDPAATPPLSTDHH